MKLSRKFFIHTIAYPTVFLGAMLGGCVLGQRSVYCKLNQKLPLWKDIQSAIIPPDIRLVTKEVAENNNLTKLISIPPIDIIADDKYKRYHFTHSKWKKHLYDATPLTGVQDLLEVMPETNEKYLITTYRFDIVGKSAIRMYCLRNPNGEEEFLRYRLMFCTSNFAVVYDDDDLDGVWDRYERKDFTANTHTFCRWHENSWLVDQIKEDASAISKQNSEEDGVK